MSALRSVIILALILNAVAAMAQQPTPPVSAVRITHPQPGAKIADSFVQVRYELVSEASAAPSPSFNVQLDDQDPVTTTTTEYTFTGLVPGQHTVVVQLVDANETPIAGARNEVKFTVVQRSPARKLPNQEGAADAMFQSDASPARLLTTTWQQGEAAAAEPQQGRRLPPASSPLPLVALVGFGVLVGGIASALKSR